MTVPNQSEHTARLLRARRDAFMLGYTLDWLSLLLRWLHIIAGAAWIGASFYFNWLNNNLRTPEERREGVGGELWALHGGHFYRVEKFTVAPEKLPKTLHWFKWEAYTTWLSGVCLLIVVYYVDAGVYLIDQGVRPLTPPVGIAIGLGTLALSWVVYHLLCKSPLGKRPVPFAIVGFALATALAFGLVQVFGSRAAYIHVGAVLGTLMAANVFFMIIPNQHVMVDAMIAGRTPDAQAGLDAAQRSLHNNYMTLPVLYIMVSNHYPFTYGHAWNWAILAALSLIGASVRHWFNLRGQGKKNVYILPVAAVAIVALAFVSAPPRRSKEGQVSFAQVRQIVDERCLTCHADKPTHIAFQAPPQGITYETAEQIKSRAQRIYQAAVITKTMPLGNLTQMTEEERKILGAWVEQGASIE